VRSSVSIRDVAMHANVSVGTVSNVLNRPDSVTTETRERVLAVIDRLGFVRNESARQLRSGLASVIGLVMLDAHNPFFTDVARGVEQAASELGHAVILCSSDGSADRQRRHLDLLEAQRVHGVLITPVDSALAPVRRLRERAISVVLVDHRVDADDIGSVGVDDRAGGELAAAHLLAEGYRRIVIVNGPASVHQARERLRGARDAFRRARRDPRSLEELAVASMDVAGGLRAGEELLARRARPDAVFCANDLLALGVLQAAVRTGIAVPEQLAIVGYDDIEFAAAAAVPLTSVRQPRELIGRTAAELVIADRGPAAADVRKHVVFTPELVVRESSRRVR